MITFNRFLLWQYQTASDNLSVEVGIKSGLGLVFYLIVNPGSLIY